jgi:hypothetical protein
MLTQPPTQRHATFPRSPELLSFGRSLSRLGDTVADTAAVMARAVVALLAALCCIAHGASALQAQSPRGWNSYNGWGHAVNETVLLQVADFMQVCALAVRPCCASRERAKP